MTAVSVDDRLQKLVDEGQEIRGLNDGQGHTHPAFRAWRQRAQAAVEDKLGADSRPALEFRDLKFFHLRMVWTDSMPPVRPDQHQAQFNRDLDEALALLIAAMEANPRPTSPGDQPLVYIEQVGNRAQASATADVHVNVTIQQLRELVATEPGLTPAERAEAMAALPDDPSDLTLEKVDKLLTVAGRARGLFSPLLGWLIAHADRIQWPS